MNKKERFEKNILAIIFRGRGTLMSKCTFVFFVLIAGAMIVMSCLCGECISFGNYEDMAQLVMGFSGIAIAILSLRVYSDDDLIALYSERSDHKDYYDHIAEYFFSMLVWLLACLGFFIAKMVDFSLCPRWLVSLLEYLYDVVLLLNILLIFDLFIKNIFRLTSKIAIKTKKKK